MLQFFLFKIQKMSKKVVKKGWKFQVNRKAVNGKNGSDLTNMTKNIFPVKVEGTQLNNKEHEMYVTNT